MNIVFAEFCSTPDFIKKKPQEKDISQYHKVLCDTYQVYANRHRMKRAKAIFECAKVEKYYKEKKCLVCNSKLRFIEGYNFWGCPNYNDGQQHTTFSDNQEPHYYVPLVNRDWVTDIIKEANLSKVLKAKEVFEYLMKLGFDDLRLEDKCRPTEQLLNTLVEAKKRSLEQEEVVLNFLHTIYKNIQYQQCIRYQIEGQAIKYAIPDFICYSEFEIMISDAKLDYPNIPQMDLYTSLIKFIANKCKDERPVNGSFVMYNDVSYMHPESEKKYHIYFIEPWRYCKNVPKPIYEL